MKLKLIVLSFFLLVISGLSFASTPKNIQIVDVTDKSFTVVWYTDQAEEGYIEWGNTVPNTIAYDLRGSSVSDKIHIIVVKFLDASTNYTFQINSGGSKYLNNGQNFSLRTAENPIDQGGQLVLNKVYMLDSNTILVSNDVFVFVRAINDLFEYSIPQVVLYRNDYTTSRDYSLGYRQYFNMNSFRDESGNVFPNPNGYELVAWTSSEGFGFDSRLTVDYVPAVIDLYLNTANLTIFEGTPTTTPVVPTGPIVPTVNPTINITTIDGLLIEDFEAGSSIFRINKLGGYNYSYKNDESLYGDSIMSEGAVGTLKSYRQNYVLQGAGAIYSGYGLDLKANKAERNIASFGAIRFIAKGAGSIAVELETTTDVISDYNHFYNVVTLTNDWKEYVISLSHFTQDSWGTQVSLQTALQRMLSLKFKAYPQVSGTNGWFQVDEIYLVSGDMGTGSTGNSIVFEKGRVITNFENGNQNKWGGYNYVYNDKASPNYGNSEVTMSIVIDGSNKVAFVSYDVNTAFSKPFVGIGFGLDAVSTNLQNISGFSGVKFRAYGSANIGLEIDSPVYVDYNRHTNMVSVANTATWNTYYIYFNSMSQNSAWGTKVSLIDVLKNAVAVQLKIDGSNDKSQINIDDVEFFYGTPANVQNLKATVFGPFAKLTWEESIGATSYLVVRNVTSYPNTSTFPVSITEGTSFVVTSGTTFQEPMIDGTVYYYSVFAYNENNLGMYSSATAADKPLYQLGGLFSINGYLTVNNTVQYSQAGSVTRSVRDGDYLQGNVDLAVSVDCYANTWNVTLYIKSNGVTKNSISVPADNTNYSKRVVIPVTLDSGINELDIFVVRDDFTDMKSNVVEKMVVADSSGTVTLKPGSKVLCYPMPYNPNNGNMDIAYELTAQGDVEVYVYNLLGQVVWRNIYSRGFTGGSTGYNQISFNGVDAFNDKLAIGLYFVQIVHGKSVLGTSKFLVTR